MIPTSVWFCGKVEEVKKEEEEVEEEDFLPRAQGKP